MNVAPITPPDDSVEYARTLANVLGGSDEVTLSVTDQELCAAALRAYATQLDAGLA